MKVFQDRVINVLLRCREVVKVDSTATPLTWHTFAFLEIVPWSTGFTSTRGMSIINAMERLWILLVCANVALGLLIPIV